MNRDDSIFFMFLFKCYSSSISSRVIQFRRNDFFNKL